VIVVGNITIGGTGKTPFINQLTKLLTAQKIKVGIVSRGYGSQINNYPHQLTNESNVHEVGDEAYMQFIDLKYCIPIVIDPDRSRAVNYMIKNNEVDLIISDDGLQHYKMSRQLEIILYDGQRQFGNQLILPVGPLREPMNRLKSVQYVIQNGSQLTSYTDSKLELTATHLVNIQTGEKHTTDYLKNKPVNAVAAIGNPQRFYQTLEKYCQIKQKISFPDHHQFQKNNFILIKDEIIVMTEKDAVKCHDFSLKHGYYLKVEMHFNNQLKDRLLHSIKSLIKEKN